MFEKNPVKNNHSEFRKFSGFTKTGSIREIEICDVTKFVKCLEFSKPVHLRSLNEVAFILYY